MYPNFTKWIFFILTVFQTGSALAGSCPLPKEGLNYIPDSERIHCVQQAHLLVGQPLDERGQLTRERVIEGPGRDELRKKQYLGFAPEEDVLCQIVFNDFGGSSKKFYCARKNELGLLFPESAKLDFLAEAKFAHTFSYVLLDENQNELTDEDGELVEADVIKVKYPDSIPPSKRQRESFTEVATSRIFWALGIPADRMYPVNSVTCEGCQEDPHGSEQRRHVNDTNLFEFATIERKYDGKRLERQTSREGRSAMARRYGKEGFGFDELAKSGAEPYQRVELEVLRLAAAIVVYHNADADFQNRLICPKKYLDSNSQKQDGESEDETICTYPIAMIQDLGSTFGTDGPGMNPRGDYSEYATRRVWVEDRENTCTTLTDFNGHTSISEEARTIFLNRLNKLIPHLPTVFELARFDLMDSGQRGTKQDKINQWVEAIHTKIMEIVFLKEPKDFSTSDLSNFQQVLSGRKTLSQIKTGRCP